MGSHNAVHRRSRATRRVAAAGAALCIGLWPETCTPLAEAAFGDLFATSTVDVYGNSQQTRVLSGNIFGAQVGIGGGNSSRNATNGNIASGLGNGATTNWAAGTVTVAVSCGGVVVCAEVGHGNILQFNFFGDNIYNPQFSIGANNSSANTTRSNIAENNGNNTVAALGVQALKGSFGRAAGNGNTLQVNILSANIVNPQLAIGGDNRSNNATSGNVSRNNGNDSQAGVNGTGPSSARGLFGPTFGNGNAIQINILSNNIINTQVTIGGSNTSEASTMGNVTENNGNRSFISVTQHYNGTKLFGNGIFAIVVGNGNTVQIEILSDNVVNIQLALHGPTINTIRTNNSTNSTTANTSSDNGNDSQTEVQPGGAGLDLTGNVIAGNGNTQQQAVGAGNIDNPQDNLGTGPVDQNPSRSGTGISRGQRPATPVSQRPERPTRDWLRALPAEAASATAAPTEGPTAQRSTVNSVSATEVDRVARSGLPTGRRSYRTAAGPASITHVGRAGGQ